MNVGANKFGREALTANAPTEGVLVTRLADFIRDRVLSVPSPFLVKNEVETYP